MTNRQAAQRLGVSLNSMLCSAWKWYPMLHGTGKCVRLPATGGRANLYPVEVIERIIAARDEADRAKAAAAAHLPEGLVDRAGACRFFGVSRYVWKHWIHEGKVTCGRLEHSPRGGRRVLYAIGDLERLREDLFGEDKLFKKADGLYHVPEDLVRREDAWELFGVSKPTWERWEREGKITCGERVPGGPKLYALAEIMRLVLENGRLMPPYPDPERPGTYRVPLCGRGIRRKEAIIDAEALPLIEGGTCHWSQTGPFGHVSFWREGAEQAIPLRRVILGIDDGKMHIGHANDDALDCRRENLVVRTVSQRVQHKRKAKLIAGRAPTSRFKGVFWETWTKKWRASIRRDGKTRRLGRFGDEVAAAVAYDEAAAEWFGEHARLNFPDGVDAWIEQDKAGWRSDPLAPQARAA
jgi:hypothetical protein